MSYKPNDTHLTNPNAVLFLITAGDPVYYKGKLTKADKLRNMTVLEVIYATQREQFTAALKKETK